MAMEFHGNAFALLDGDSDPESIENIASRVLAAAVPTLEPTVENKNLTDDTKNKHMSASGSGGYVMFKDQGNGSGQTNGRGRGLHQNNGHPRPNDYPQSNGRGRGFRQNNGHPDGYENGSRQNNGRGRVSSHENGHANVSRQNNGRWRGVSSQDNGQGRGLRPNNGHPTVSENGSAQNNGQGRVFRQGNNNQPREGDGYFPRRNSRNYNNRKHEQSEQILHTNNRAQKSEQVLQTDKSSNEVNRNNSDGWNHVAYRRGRQPQSDGGYAHGQGGPRQPEIQEAEPVEQGEEKAEPVGQGEEKLVGNASEVSEVKEENLIRVFTVGEAERLKKLADKLSEEADMLIKDAEKLTQDKSAVKSNIHQRAERLEKRAEGLKEEAERSVENQFKVAKAKESTLAFAEQLKKEAERLKEEAVEAKMQTLKEYEKQVEEKKAALESAKSEGRKVNVKDFESMQIVGKKNHQENNLVSNEKLKRSGAAGKDVKSVRKTVTLEEYQEQVEDKMKKVLYEKKKVKDSGRGEGGKTPAMKKTVAPQLDDEKLFPAL